MRKILFFVAITGFLTACASFQKTQSPQEQLEQDVSSSQIEPLVILGLNDFHGHLMPVKRKSKEPDGQPSLDYETGGASILASHIRIQKEKWGQHFLLLDAGDEFQGTIESNSNEGQAVVSFFNAVGIQGAAVGNHEFDFGPEGKDPPAMKDGTVPGDPQGALKARMREARYPYLSANIVDKSTKHHPPFQNLFPSQLYTVGNLKVGVVGLSTLQTPVTTRATFVRNLAFTNAKEATIREAKKLRDQGAEVVLILAHIGLKCKLHEKGPHQHRIHKPNDPHGECESDDEMVRLIEDLPNGTVDAVVSGHSHTVVHHWVKNIPVIQSGAFNRYYTLLHLRYSKKEKRILADQTRIEGPIPVCPQIFENQEDCDGDKPAPFNGRGDLITPKLYGEKIKPDSSVETLLEPVVQSTENLKNQIVGESELPLNHMRSEEAPLGNLIADAVRAGTHTQVAFVNPGGIRAPIDAGKITYEQVFRSLPFDNALSHLTMTGHQLKLLVRVIESGSRGFFPISGLKVRVIDLGIDAPSSDLNGNGRIDPWEVNRLLDVKLEDGSPIVDDKLYTVGTVDFLVTGGDDLGWVMSQIPQDRVILDTGTGVVRDALVNFLAKSGLVNTKSNPLVKSDAPRIERVKWNPKDKKSKKKKGNSSRRKKKK